MTDDFDFERELERRLADYAERTDDPGTDQRVADRVRATLRHRRNRRRGTAVFGIGVAAAVAAVVGYQTVAGPGSSESPVAGDTPSETTTPSKGPTLDELHTPPNNDDIGDVPQGVFPKVGIGESCPWARHADSVDQLKTNTPVWTPEPGAVPGTQIRDMWTCYGQPEIMFGPIDVTYETGWRGETPTQHAQDFVEDWGGHTETILGRTAYVNPADPNPHRRKVHDWPAEGWDGVRQIGSPDHEVVVVVDGVAISAYAPGDEIPIAKVVDLIDSFQLPPELSKD